MRLCRKTILTALPLCLTLSQSHAQTGDAAVIAPVAETGDFAAAMIGFLFRGETLPDSFPFSGARLIPIADALRDLLSAYGAAMLGVAALLVAYQVAVMVAETAHQGVFMGRRANQIWGPVRLIVAIMLLVPLGGLSVGQRIVLRIAMAGSTLASHAWTNMADAVGESFLALTPPRGPDTGTFALAASEMELCRSLYNQAVAAPANATALRLAGIIGDIQKLPASPAFPETWRYTNTLNADAPLCGEFRFAPLPFLNPSPDAGVRLAQDAGAFSRAAADTTLMQARTTTAQAFAAGDAAATPDLSAAAALRHDMQRQVDTRLRIMDETLNALAAKSLTQFEGAGWVSAGFVLPDLMRRQESYGDLADHLLPQSQEPVFMHRVLTQQVLGDAVAADPVLRVMDRETLDGLFRFYAAAAHANGRAHDQGYADSAGAALGGVEGFDLRDHVTAASDAGAAFGMLGQATSAAAQNTGVWGGSSSLFDSGNPFASGGARDRYNPLSAMIEFGRRQVVLGKTLIGFAGSIMPQAQLGAAAMGAGVLGGLLALGGCVLMFVIPLLPFARLLYAILVWTLELAEALLAMPLVALAHISLTGEGISGSAARQAYMLWIALAIRPVLSVAGFVVGVLAFSLGLSVVMMACAPLAQLAGTGGGTMPFANAALVLAYDLFALIVAHAAFRGITIFPDRALRWISPYVMADAATATSIAPGATLASAVAAVTHQAGIHGRSSSSGQSTRNAGAASGAAAQSMNSHFPTYGGKDNAAFSAQSPGAKAASKSTSVTIAPPIASAAAQSSASATGGMAKIAGSDKDRKDDKDTPFSEHPFFAGDTGKGRVKKSRDDKPEDGKPQGEKE
jgi:conjugal transfer/type IV secretion protein DotA/TraY